MLHRVGLVLGLSVLTLAGCSRLSISNNSLDYKNAKVLAPLSLPSDATRPMAAIYPAPAIDPAALAAAPDYVNRKGNRFEMPLPRPMQAANDQANVAGIGAPTAPVLVTDGNGYPLMRIEGDASQVWELLNTSLSVANIKVLKHNQKAGWFAIEVDGRTLYLRLNHSGALTTISVQDSNNVLVDKTIASDVLNQLSQNWPA